MAFKKQKLRKSKVATYVLNGTSKIGLEVQSQNLKADLFLISSSTFSTQTEAAFFITSTSAARKDFSCGSPCSKSLCFQRRTKSLQRPC